MFSQQNSQNALFLLSTTIIFID